VNKEEMRERFLWKGDEMERKRPVEGMKTKSGKKEEKNRGTEREEEEKGKGKEEEEEGSKKKKGNSLLSYLLVSLFFI
jgi:hypothetical protein